MKKGSSGGGWFAVMIAAAGMMAAVVWADGRSVQVNEQQVRAWNAFAETLAELHRRQLSGRRVREEERIGGYARQPRFYREVSYVDADSGRLLSRIQWEREAPQRIHSIEVNVYDERGRLARDYLAWYLPDARNAPWQTTVNLHHYDDDLHGWRQFDASGRRIYEKCTRLPGEKPVFEISGEDGIWRAQEDLRSVMHTAGYRRCFGTLPAEGGKWLTPQ